MANCNINNVSDDHAGIGHDNCQCRPATYARQLVHDTGTDFLGVDLLYNFCGDHDAADRLSCKPIWPAANVYYFGRWFHIHVDVVWRRCFVAPIGIFPDLARRLWRWAGAVLAGITPRYLSTRKTRASHGVVGCRDNGRPYPRTYARRISHGLLRLALGLLY